MAGLFISSSERHRRCTSSAARGSAAARGRADQLRGAIGRAAQRVADDRVAEGQQVHAQLVRAAGDGLQGELALVAGWHRRLQHRQRVVFWLAGGGRRPVQARAARIASQSADQWQTISPSRRWRTRRSAAPVSSALQRCRGRLLTLVAGRKAGERALHGGAACQQHQAAGGLVEPAPPALAGRPAAAPAGRGAQAVAICRRWAIARHGSAGRRSFVEGDQMASSCSTRSGAAAGGGRWRGAHASGPRPLRSMEKTLWRPSGEREHRAN